MPQSKQFTASDFTDYEREYKGGYGTAAHKARFATALTKFVLAGFQESKFTKDMYTTLSNCFGHIAHYNKWGFYDVWFSNDQRKLEWLTYVATHTNYGDPEFTYVDVENAIKQWVFDSHLIEFYEERVGNAIEAAERAKLAELKAKYPEE